MHVWRNIFFCSREASDIQNQEEYNKINISQNRHEKTYILLKPFKDGQDKNQETFHLVTKTDLLITTHNKKHYNGRFNSFVCLIVEHIKQ